VPSAPGRPARSLPDLQRGLHRNRRCRPAAQRADRGGDPPHPGGQAPSARRRRSRRPAGADAADGGPACSASTGRRQPGAARGAGPLAVDESYIEEGVALVTEALSTASLGPYQLQAAIAAIHDERPARPTPTGRRFSRSTRCSSASRRTPWSRSTGPSRLQWCVARRTDSTSCARSTPIPRRRASPARGGACASPGDRRRSKSGSRELSDGGTPHDQPPGAAIPRVSSRRARRARRVADPQPSRTARSSSRSRAGSARMSISTIFPPLTVKAPTAKASPSRMATAPTAPLTSAGRMSTPNRV
jgi:hypothetical protein